METIVKIECVVMRGGPAKMVIATDDGKQITIRLNDDNTLKLIKLLTGGPQPAVTLPCETG